MDFQSSALAGQMIAPQVQTPPAPAVEPDGRASADAAAVKKDPIPDVPMPIPASPTQSGLVSEAALSKADAAPKLDASGVSSAERTLKPYGISMLPDRSDDSPAPDAEPDTDEPTT